MTTDIVHPEQLLPGQQVGAWRIVKRLGTGGSACVFMVEREGAFFAMKMALRPVSEEVSDDEVAMRFGYEAAALFTYAPHRHLLRVHAVDCWPQPRCGYWFIVTDLVEGDDWHVWRWRTNPNATILLDAFSDVVRTVGVLHERGVFHRDLKAENLLVRRVDGHVFLIDFGRVRLPGTFAQTLGVPEGALHLLPPELIAYTRSEVWKQGVRFEGGVGADLYALGVLLYQSLTNRHPFNPKLSDKALVAAIATVLPVAPHLLNAQAPRALSEIAMKLLEKEPAARYADTEALLRALWLAGRERTSTSWKVPLLMPSELGPVEATPSEKEEWLDPRRHDAPSTEDMTPPESDPVHDEEKPPPPRTPRTWRTRQIAAFLVGVLVLLLLASWMGRATLLPSAVAEPMVSLDSEKGSASMSSSSHRVPPRLAVFSVWLCTVMGLGCPAAQVKPKPENCSEEAKRNMFEVLKLHEGMRLEAIIDVKQPGPPTELGTYQDGPIIGRVAVWERAPPQLPGGTLLYGRLWTGPGIEDRLGNAAVEGRYTEAVLPDGRKMAVCFVLGGPSGYPIWEPGSKPGAVRLPFQLTIGAVRRWP